jgi:hypothetical protein
MKNEKEDPKVCANPGCGRPVEEAGVLCDSCSLEWSLFHREVRAESDVAEHLPPPPSDNALLLS